MALPKISIVTVSYNSAMFIERTIQSVVSQNYPALEYIIIDGGSTDGTQDIIRKYADKISYWTSEKDKGQYDAINKGFAKTTGDILAFLNADDVYLPWTLQTVSSIFTSLKDVNWLTSLNVSMIDQTGAIFSNGAMRPISTTGFRKGLYIPGNANFGCIVQEGTFWRRELWDKAGSCIDLEYSLAGDFDLWSKFSEHTRLYCLGQPLAAMTRHSGQRSNRMDQYQAECRRSLEASSLRHEGVTWTDQTAMIRKARSNRMAWTVVRRFTGHRALVIDPVFNDKDFSIYWSASEIPIY